MDDALAPYRPFAYNSARESENKMHDDDVARQFGFVGRAGTRRRRLRLHGASGRGALAANLSRARRAEARFVKPVYDGEPTTITAQEANGSLDIEVTCRDELCATGHARLGSLAGTAACSIRGRAGGRPAPRRPMKHRSRAIDGSASAR